jgi:hypothetical protein
MPLLSARLLIPVAIVVVAWGALHALGAHNLAVTPGSWPAPAASPSASPRDAGAPVPPAAKAPAPSAAGLAGIPVLPGALQQLNGSTRDTAVGLYALIQQLEQALRTHLQQLVQQLEPGR